MTDLAMAILTHPAFGVVTFLIGMLAGNYLAIGRDRRKEFNQAAATFKSKVLSELEGLYPIPTNWPKDINTFLRDKFPRLQIAVNEFKTYLPKNEQAELEKAWFIYRAGEDSPEAYRQYYWQYIPSSGSTMINGKEVEHDNTSTYQSNFKCNVDNLLKFAEIK